MNQELLEKIKFLDEITSLVNEHLAQGYRSDIVLRCTLCEYELTHKGQMLFLPIFMDGALKDHEPALFYIGKTAN